ncbi:MAG TPA: carbohydrate porin [Steroidobacteraceae bacterium]|nr:carbohydrate porin [Steroidobacteraceae bacterium]
MPGAAQVRGGARALRPVALAALLACTGAARAADAAPGAAEPAPDSTAPQLLAAQYTLIEQQQSALESPYAGRLSLYPDGDRQPTNTIGVYTGWAPLSWGQLYFDTEKFMGAGVSGATGLGGLTNGDVIREGVPGLKKQFYVARFFARFMLPLPGAVASVARAQDQIAGTEAVRRIELKVGQMSASDDFDRNSYANSARTQFLNWSLWNNTAWDFAANTRGYTDGFVVGYISPAWSLKYGMYRMPLFANAQTMETLLRAREQNLELTLSPAAPGTIVRLLGYYNVARMGDYAEALALAAATGTVPNVAADDMQGRHKFGYGLNAEQPLADGGDSGVFVRLGWQDGKTEDFVFTEVDRHASAGGQLSGVHWGRGDDRLGVGMVLEGLSDVHRDYLAAGGSGFLLGDGRLNYGEEQILESYYRARWTWAAGPVSLRAELTPDFQYIQNPGFNRDRGPVRFYALRLHLEY